jgi:hypothetical protein
MISLKPGYATAAAVCGAVLFGSSLGGIASVDRTLQAAVSRPAVGQERGGLDDAGSHHHESRHGREP